MTSPLKDRTAERAVLGAFIDDPACIAEVQATEGAALVSSDFAWADHVDLFDLLQTMRREGQPIDPVTVASRVMQHERSTYCGGQGAVMALTAGVVSTINVAHYARTVRALAMKRAALRVLKDAEERVPVDDAAPTIQNAIHELQGLLDRTIAGRFVTAAEVADDALFLCRKDKDDTHLPPPWPELTAYWPRIKPGLVLIGADTGHGKTLIGRHLARYLSRRGRATLTIGLEMDPDEMLVRELVDKAGVPMGVAQRGLDPLNPADRSRWEALNRARDEHLASEGAHLDSFYDGLEADMDGIGQSITSWATKATRQGHRLGGVLLDYVQLVEVNRDGRSDEKLAALSRTLKLASKRWKVPVFALSQLTMPKERKEPVVGDLRGSRNLGMDADVVLMGWRPNIGNDELSDEPDTVMMMKLAKGRALRLGTTSVPFDGAYQRVGRAEGRDW